MQRPDSKEIEAQASSTLHAHQPEFILFSKKKNRTLPISRQAAANVSERGRASAAHPPRTVPFQNPLVCACPEGPRGSCLKRSDPAPVPRDPRLDPTARGALNSKPSVPGSGRTLCQPTTGINSPQRLRLAGWETRRDDDATPEASLSGEDTRGPEEVEEEAVVLVVSAGAHDSAILPSPLRSISISLSIMRTCSVL